MIESSQMNDTAKTKPHFEAAITGEQMHEGEKTAQNWGVARRIAYATLTRNSEQLAIKDEATAEALLEAVEQISDYMKWRESETEMLEAAQARLMSVLSSYVAECEGKEATA